MGRVGLGYASVVQRGTREHVASQWLQPAGGRGDVLVSRQAGAMREKTNDHSRWCTDGILERLGLPIVRLWLWSKGGWCEGILERLRWTSGVTPPGARVRLTPLPYALDLGRACEVITVRGLVQPAALAGGCAGVAARRRGAGALASGAARVGIKAGLTRLTRALTQWTSHWSASPQANDQGIGAWKEENGEAKSALKKLEENGRRGYISRVGKKTERPDRQFYPGRLHAVSGRR